MHIFMNGDIIPEVNAHIHINDRGFLLGDGLFETFKSESGDIQFFSEHFERLEKSAKFFSIPLLRDHSGLLEACNNLLHINNLLDTTASLRITLSRGVALRGINIPAEQNPTLLISASQYHPSKDYYPSVFITSAQRNQHSPIVKHKTLNYLEQILARTEAQKNGFDEGLMINGDGFITECSCANIFFVRNEEVITPHIDSGILPGVVRRKVIDLCIKSNIRIIEKDVSVEEALGADEVFQTNSLIGIQYLSAINKKMFTPDAFKITKNISALYIGTTRPKN